MSQAKPVEGLVGEKWMEDRRSARRNHFALAQVAAAKVAVCFPRLLQFNEHRGDRDGITELLLRLARGGHSVINRLHFRCNRLKVLLEPRALLVIALLGSGEQNRA